MSQPQQKRRPVMDIPTTKMPQTSFSFPLSGLSGLKTPDLLLNLMKQDPAVNTNSAAIFKSPDWTLSIHTPELSSILDLGGATASTLFPGFDGPASASGGDQRSMERNPFSESFTAVSSKSVAPAPTPASAASAASAPTTTVIPSAVGSLVKAADMAAQGIVVPRTGRSGTSVASHQSYSQSGMSEEDEEDDGGSSMSGSEDDAPLAHRRSLPGLVHIATSLAGAEAAAADGSGKKQPGKRGRKRNATEPTDDPVEEKKRRRRERNRIAAATCRQRKIDRENTLRDELKDLHARHGDLFNTMVALQKELVSLKHEAVKHMEAGCTGFEA